MSIFALWTMAPYDTPEQMHSALLRWNLTWREFVDQHIRPDLDWGVRTVMLHLPFGKDTLADGFMSFDSYLHAQKRGLRDLWHGFARAWRPVVQGKYTGGEPVRLICYLGSLHHDHDFTKLLARRYKADQWWRRVWASTRAILKCDGELAFDTAGTWPATSPAYGFVHAIRAMGRGGHIEGTELVRRPADQPFRWREPGEREWHYWNPELVEFSGHWRGFPVTANHGNFWRNIMKEGHPNSQFDSIAHYGEVTLMIGGHAKPDDQEMSAYAEWSLPMIRRNTEAGYNSAVFVRWLREAGVKMEDVTE